MRAGRSAPDLALGIDLGGTKILAGVVDGKNRILGRGKLKTPFRGNARELTAALVEAADLALKEAGAARERVSALAVAAPGPVDAEKGVLLFCANVAVRNLDVGAALGGPFPKARRRLENDVRLAAYGEAHLGAGRGAAVMVAFWVGTGVGGAVIVDGRIWKGRYRNAGEIGHIQVDVRRAKPGRIDGTLEGIGAKVGMARFLRRKLEDGEKSVLRRTIRTEGARLRGSELKAAVEAGDPLALRAVARSARAVGIAMANVFNILSPDRFVLGGGVATDLGARYLANVRKWAEAFCFTTELGGIEIVPAGLGDDAGVLGAALYAREPAV
jgi:glucokinase